MTLRKYLLVATTIFTALATTSAAAQWPDQPINLIVSYSAGGGTDLTARTLAPFLEKEIDAEIVVVNRTGAGGEVGHSAIANAKPDGYTMGILNLPPAITLPITRDTDFQIDDFQPVANLVADPSAISVASNSKFKTLEELISYAQKNPASVTVATTGVGTDDHFAVLELEEAAGIDLTPVPFPGSAPARIALLGGHVAAAAINLGEMSQFPGKVRVLAHLGAKRSPVAPDVPTFSELGYDTTLYSERGIVFPKGVDKKVVETVAAAVKRIVENPEYQEQVKKHVIELNYMSPEEFGAHIQQLDAKYHELWKKDPWM